MKIRTQFIFLLLGVLIVPILVGAGLLWLQRMKDRQVYSVPGYEEISAAAGDAVRRSEWEALSDFFARRKGNMDFLVLRGDGRVVYSTDPAALPASVVDDRTLLSLIRDTSDRYLYFFDSPVLLENKETLVIMRLARVENRPPASVERLAGYLILVLAAVFLFSAAMAIAIARSITRSVTSLEDATRRIAAGDLDLAVDARGSNEISSLSTSLNSMRLALKEDSARRSRFIMGVSHDLKTPLALIKGYTELIGDGMARDGEALARSLGIIGSKVDQLDGMIDDLMDFVKMDTGEWLWTLERVPLLQTLESYRSRIALDAELLGRSFECDFALDSALTVPMDQRLFLRALENLVNNALRYTAPGGTVRLGASVEGENVVVRVADDGPGMTGEELSRIFDPFYRGSASRREQGFGLGLAVVKGVADSHGWTLAVRSELGAGSEFSIAMPLSE